MDISAVRDALGADYARVDYIDETGSTNTDLLADASAPDRSLLLAGHQTAGKGRLGRTWTAPAGAQLIFSTLLVDPDLSRIGTVTLAAGLAVTDAIDGAVLKWPNDVLIDGRKLAGILAEMSGGNRVVIGVGINHELTRDELPVAHATSLVLEGIDRARVDLAIDVLRALRRRLDQWEDGDPALLDDYRERCSSIGEKVRLEAPTGDIVGTVDEVADDGRILIDGEAYSAGDVTHLRRVT